MDQRRTTPTPPPDELLRRLGHLTGQVMARIELQQARVALAVELQRHMLPPELPGLPGLQTAARYVPAQTGLDIGGDWYDAFVLPDGSLGFAIGDVQGHDVEAAAFMGMVRTGLRAVAGATTDPGDVLSRANNLLVSMSSDLLTTCTFLRFDPVTGELAYPAPDMYRRSGAPPRARRCSRTREDCRWASFLTGSTRSPAMRLSQEERSS